MLQVDGLVSGFDTTRIIEEILTYERRPVTLLQQQVDEATQRKTAFLEVSAKLLSLQAKAQTLARSDTFRTVQVTSSNEGVLAASGTSALAPGSTTFRVARLARTGSYAAGGFETADTTAVGAGTLWIELGDARVDRETDLELLNGGRGVDRGSIRITDRAGNVAIVDLSAAVTASDVLDAINRAEGVQVSAATAGASDDHPGQAIVLTDQSGGSGTLRVEDIGTATTARDLGILGSASGATLQGGDIIGLERDLALGLLNDGNGVAVRTGSDLVIRQKDGNSFSVDLSSARTIGDVLDLVNNDTGNGGITVSIASDGNSLQVADSTSGSYTTRIQNGTDGRAATDLGIEIDTSSSSVEGERIVAGLDTVLLRTLNGGSGVAAGSIQITDRSGASATVDLSSAETLAEVLEAIENASGIAVTASVNRTGNGILLRDTTGGSGTFQVAEAGSTTAADLGILRSIDDDAIDGDPLSIQYVARTTRLAALRGGRGVRVGRIRITDKAGIAFTVDLSQEETVGEVMDDIAGAASAAGSDLTVGINSDGNGIILTSPTGTGTLRVEELDGGTTAADLGILGSAAGSTRSIDGSARHAISIDADDTLEDVVEAIENLDLDVSASILNDGSPVSPYRLSITSTVSGRAGSIVVDSQTTDLAFERVAAGQDAALFLGEGEPVIVRSRTNTFDDTLEGLTVTALSVSDEPVTITATRDPDAVVEAVQDFVDAYNEIVSSVAELTAWDTETETAGILIGDGTLRSITRTLSRALVRAVADRPAGWNLASSVGLRITRTGELTLDESALREKLAEDPEAVEALFTAARTLQNATLLEDFRNGQGVRTTDGGAEFRIHQRDGTTIDVDISGDRTVRDLLLSINEASDNTGDLVASISGDERAIVLTDSSTGSETFRVTAQNSSPAFNDLGINRSADASGGGVITGSSINLTEDEGLARRLVEVIQDFVEPGEGAIEIRTDGIESRIEDLQDRIETLQERLGQREEALRRQFAQLEILLGQNQNTLAQLQSSLAGLQSAFTRRR